MPKLRGIPIGSMFTCLAMATTMGMNAAIGMPVTVLTATTITLRRSHSLYPERRPTSPHPIMIAMPSISTTMD
jgi:hypothetical protein